MDYQQIREHITDGSLVFFKPATMAARLITFFTRGEVSHCGILIWIKDSRDVPRLAVLEGHMGGCRLTTMSWYAKRPAYILNVGLDWETVENYAYAKTGSTAYGYLDFITIWLKETLVRLGLKGLASKVPNTAGEVCSEVVADILQNAGFDIESTLVSPQKLLEYARTKEIIELRVN